MYRKLFNLIIIAISALVFFNCKTQENKQQLIRDKIPEYCDTSLFLKDSTFYTKDYCRTLEKSRGAIEVKIPYEDSNFSKIFGDRLFGGVSEDDLKEKLFFLREDKETGLHDISYYNFYEPFDSKMKIKSEADKYVFSQMVRKYFYYDETIETLFGVKMKDSIDFKSYQDLILCTKAKLEKEHGNSRHLKKDSLTLYGFKGDIPHQDLLQYNEYTYNDSLTNNKAITERFIVDYGLTKKQKKQYARLDREGNIHWDYYHVKFYEKQISVYYSLIPFNEVEYYKKYIRKDSLY